MGLIQEFQKADAERRTEVASQLGEYAAMAPERRTEVASQIGEYAAMAPERRAEVASQIGEYAAMAPERRAEVASQIGEYAAMAPERRAEVWGGVVTVVPSAAPSPVVERPAFTPPVPLTEEGPEEEAVEWAEVGEVTAEFASLTDRVFQRLANHPDGTRLTELEQEFQLNRFLSGRAIRHLIDEGKVEKRDRLYFAV